MLPLLTAAAVHAAIGSMAHVCRDPALTGALYGVAEILGDVDSAYRAGASSIEDYQRWIQRYTRAD